MEENNPSTQPQTAGNNLGWLKIVLLGLAGMIFLVGVFYAVIKYDASKQQKTVPDQTNQIVITGVIRTSGLSEEEKQKFDLAIVSYQITDFGDYQKTYQEKQALGYYLLSKTVNGELLGKCVRVAGTIPQKWENNNSYNRTVLVPSKIEKLDYSSCNPYLQTPPVYDNTQEKLVLRGTVTRGKT